MMKINKIHLFKNKLQLLLLLLFWLAYFIINIVSTQFFSAEKFQVELLLQSLLYSAGGLIFSFLGYKLIKIIRTKIQSNVNFLLLAILFVFIATYLWVISHHFSWWLVSGDGIFFIKFLLYPIKALIYSTIILPAILLLILTEKKSLLTSNTNNQSTLDIQNFHDLFENKESDYEDMIFLPIKNKILNIKIDSIKLIQANDYYSNIISEAYDKTILSKYPLKKWELILPKKHFLRIHRSSIINLNYIDNIEKMDNHTYEIKIKGLTQNVSMSRRCAKTVLDKFQL
jgi:LytTr DNA-binding domain